MKAAILHEFGESPRYEDFPDPTPEKDEILVRVKAVALENFDKAIARGSHYATHQLLPKLPAVIGTDGIGMLDDGGLVGFATMHPPYGAMAEKAAIPKTHYVPVPDGLDAATAAALPSSTLTSLLAFKWAVKLQLGETVLVNGATGFAGKLAIQVAKLLGAGRVIGTGRNEEALRSLHELGADAIIDLKQTDEQLADSFTKEAGQGYDIILDFLWGHPTEVLVKTLVPYELGFAQRRVRLLQIGEMAGPTISLSADALRTSGLEIYGAGNIPPEAIPEAVNQAWEWIRQGKLHADIEQVPLKDVESAWQRTDLHGKRIVIIP
jgi:NADPH2:quinone reductase